MVEENLYNINAAVVDSLDKAPTLDTSCRGCYGKQNGTIVTEKIYPIEGNGIRESHQGRGYSEVDKMYTLNTVEKHAVAQVSIGGGTEVAVDLRNQKEDNKNGALQSKASNNLQSNNVVRQQYAVRRLTPLECERLQSLPDGWTKIDHKSCSDSARYRALGNGMAQNVPDWILQRLVKEVDKQNAKATEETIRSES